MLLRPITPQPLLRHLKLPRAIPKAHKPQHPQQQPDRLGRDILHGADVHSLRVIPQPVAKVHALDVELAELLAAHGARGEKREEHIFNVAVAPVLAFDFGGARDVACAEGERGAGEEENSEEQEGEDRGSFVAVPHGCLCA